MALSDACFQFLTDVAEAAGRLAEEAHHYSAPDLSLSQTQSGWRLIENWAMLLPDVGFVQTDLWDGDGSAAVASSA